MNRMMLGGALAGVLVVLGVWWFGMREPVSPTPLGPQTPVSRPPAGPTAVPPDFGGVAGPTVGSATPTPGVAAQPSGRTDPGANARPRLEDIQAELNALKAGGRTPQPAELDAVYEKLERYNGGPTMAGVDLRAVRKNLQAAARIQALAEEMRPLAQNPSPENVQKMQALLSQMREAQSGLSPDVGSVQVPR